MLASSLPVTRVGITINEAHFEPFGRLGSKQLLHFHCLCWVPVASLCLCWRQSCPQLALSTNQRCNNGKSRVFFSVVIGVTKQWFSFFSRLRCISRKDVSSMSWLRPRSRAARRKARGRRRRRIWMNWRRKWTWWVSQLHFVFRSLPCPQDLFLWLSPPSSLLCWFYFFLFATSLLCKTTLKN